MVMFCLGLVLGGLLERELFGTKGVGSPGTRGPSVSTEGTNKG